MTKELKLNFGFTITDLRDREGLMRLQDTFLDYLKDKNPAAYDLYKGAEEASAEGAQLSELILAVGPVLDAFIATLFQVPAELLAGQKSQAHTYKTLFAKFDKNFMQRRVLRHYKAEEGAEVDLTPLGLHPSGPNFYIHFAESVLKWLDNPQEYAFQLDAAEKYATWALYSLKAPTHLKDFFFAPQKLDFDHLVKQDTPATTCRNGFNYKPENRDHWAMGQVNYCLLCHHRDKDSCAKGLKEKDSQRFQTNTLNNLLTGCPLEQKISEMNELYANGYLFAPLAAITLDNPMVAATGDRICNDCKKACIFQKQAPVDVPAIETTILNNILENIPYGAEVYGLLTRWNPLNLKRPYPNAPTHKKVLVVGMGPAGFTLAHHLLQEGHTVVGVDGLKIEPLTKDDGPLSWQNLNTPLEDRIIDGFGGVAEYGITPRWNKQKLKLIRILLEQNKNFKLLGGVRMGESFTPQDVFDLGFDHVALCMGAGKPRVLNIKNAMAKGVRQASDFLMALQLTGAYKHDNLSNLTVRLPIVVVGGGLTAVDTATEALAYYPRQVQKFYKHYTHLVQKYGKETVEASWSAEDREIAAEFIAHAKALEQSDNAHALLQKWGGATIAYRQDFTKAPSYRLNHEEVQKALEEGIKVQETLDPKAIEVDQQGYVKEIQFKDGQVLPAKTILVAAGTQPNTVLARENQTLKIQDKYFQAFDENWQQVTPEGHPKTQHMAIFTYKNQRGNSVSFFGDLHPDFNGSVVKAMASAKRGYPLISSELAKLPVNKDPDFLTNIEDLFSATVHQVNRLADSIIEVIIKAPWAAKKFKPGQFFRLQNYEADAHVVNGVKLTMEGVALTGAWADPEQGLISTVVLEMGASSRLCSILKPNQPVVFMGPTGTPTEIPEKETVVLTGGGLGNAVLFSIGQAMRAKGCKVIYFAAYKKPQDRFMVDQIHKAADTVVWCCEGGMIQPTRDNDFGFKSNIVESMTSHKDLLISADRLITIGSDRMMAAVHHACQYELKGVFKPSLKTIASINSPMQCMMKEICGQCIQRHVDPNTGQESYVFSCMNQDQNMKTVDFKMLSDRLNQNSLQEKLTDLLVRSLNDLKSNR